MADDATTTAKEVQTDKVGSFPRDEAGNIIPGSWAFVTPYGADIDALHARLDEAPVVKSTDPIATAAQLRERYRGDGAKIVVIQGLEALSENGSTPSDDEPPLPPAREEATEPHKVDLRTVFRSLADEARWVGWKYVGPERKKIPIDPKDGGPGKSNNPDTWATLDDAERAVERYGLAGVGFVLGDGFGGIDLDACRDPDTGEVTDWAQRFVDGFSSYAEVSPSGTGVKIIAAGAPEELPANEAPMNGEPIGGKAPQVEAYTSGRYFTVTGRLLGGCPDEIRDCGELGDAWDRMTRFLRERGGDRSDGPAPQVEGVVPSGQRNNVLTSLAGTMRRRGMEEPEILAALRATNKRRCQPPLPDGEVESIAASVSRYPPGKPIRPIPSKTARSFAGRDERSEKGRRRGDVKQREHQRKLPAPMGIPELLEVEEPDEEFLVEGLLPAGGNILFAGYPKTYKTFYLLDLAVSLASQTPFLGKFDVPERRRVGIVLMEDRAHRVRWRLKRLCAGRELRLSELEDWLHFWFRPPLRLSDETAVELAEYAAELDLDYLHLDSWAYVAAGDSNSADDVTPQLQALSACRVDRPGIGVGLTHHARKAWGRDMGGTRLTDEIRNSSAFGAWYDAGFVLSRKDESSPVKVRAELRDHPAPDSFAFTVEDEDPAGPHNGYRSGGWLRLKVSEHRPEVVERIAAAEQLMPAVRDFLSEHPDGVSRSKLRDGITARNSDIEAAFELLEEAGEATYKPAPGPGKASTYRLLTTDPARPCPDPAPGKAEGDLAHPAQAPIRGRQGQASPVDGKPTDSGKLQSEVPGLLEVEE